MQLIHCIFILTPAGSIKETKTQQNQLNWYIQSNSLIIDVHEKYFGNGEILLTDLLGRSLIDRQVYFDSNKFSINISSLPSGIYIVKLRKGTYVGTTKIIISR